MAEGGGLLNRYRGVNLYRGFESLLLRSYFPQKFSDPYSVVCCVECSKQAVALAHYSPSFLQLWATIRSSISICRCCI